jgi:hypothetical protein
VLHDGHECPQHWLQSATTDSKAASFDNSTATVQPSHRNKAVFWSVHKMHNTTTEEKKRKDYAFRHQFNERQVLHQAAQVQPQTECLQAFDTAEQQ